MPEDDPLIGKLIDRRYRVISKLGGGGMGTVYEVEHLGPSMLLIAKRALKLIKGELASEVTFRQRFFREAQWLNESRHPHIVAVHDFQEDAEYGLFLVMELVRGPNLKAVIESQKRLPYTEVLRIAREVASALHHVHSLERVHRDIKPANILIEEGTGRAVVTDFGIAKDLKSTGDETLTGTHQMVGTVKYASPEQLGGDRDAIDPRSDIYSLGAVIFEMYTGEFGGMGTVARLKYPEPPPGDFQDLVRGCLELDAERRIGSAAALIEHLQRCEVAHRERLVQGTAPVSEPLAASSEPVRAPERLPLGEAGETAATRVIAEGTRVEPGTPPPIKRPSEGTTTIQERQAVELREEVLRVQIEAQHRAIDELRGQCLDLQQFLSGFGISTTGFTAIETVGEQLTEVGKEPNLEHQLARLEVLHGNLGEAREGIANALQQAAAGAAEQLRERAAGLAPLGAEYVDQVDLRRLDETIARAAERIEAAGWEPAREALESARQLLENLTAEAQARAERIVERVLAAADDASEALAALSPPDSEPVAMTATARAEAAALLSQGRFDAARGVARRAAAAIDDAVREREVLSERAQILRTAAAAEREGLDPEAQAIAGTILAEARSAGERAEEALDGRDFAAAIEFFEREAELYAEARGGVERVRGERAAELRGEVEELLKRALQAPATVVGRSVQAAEELLAHPPRDARSAIEAYTGAAAELGAAIAVSVRFEVALERQQEARRRQSQVAGLALSAADLRAAEEALRSADQAWERASWDESTSLYEVAAERFARLEEQHQRSEEEKAQARTEAEASLAAELERAAGAPAELAGEEIARAEEILGGSRPASFGAEMTALAEAQRSLRGALARRPAYEDALAARAELETVPVDVTLDEEERAEIDEGRRTADDAFAEGDWVRAAELFRRSAAAGIRIGAEHRRRAEVEEMRRARASAEERRGAVDGSDAAELAAESFERAEDLWQAARAEEERQPLAAADLYQQAASAYGATAAAVAGIWSTRLAAARADLEAAVELSRSAPEALVLRERQAAMALLDGNDARPPRQHLGDLARAQAGIETALSRQEEHDDARAHGRALDAAWEHAQAAGLGPDDLGGIKRLLDQGAAAFVERDWQRARDLFEEGVGEAARAEDAFRRREEQGRAEAEGAAAARARAGVDLDLGSEAAAADTAAAEQLWSRARQSESDGDFVGAAESYRQAAEVFGALAQTLEQHRQTRRAEAEEALRAALAHAEEAPDELAGAARQAAREILEGKRPAEFRAEIAALGEAASRLDDRLAQRGEYDEVARLRREVDEQWKALAAARKLGRRQRRAFESAAAAATEAAGAGDWARAREQLAAEQVQLRGWSEAPAPPKRPIGKIAAAGAGLVAVAGAVVVYVNLPTPAPGPKPEARPTLQSRTEATVAAPGPKVEQPEPAPPPLQFANAQPPDAKVRLQEGARQAFSINVTGGKPGSTPDIRWLLDQQKVATGKSWDYAPSFKDGGEHVVVASIGDDLTQKWNVEVENVNRPPVVEANRKPGTTIEANPNDTVSLSVKATDADDDPLKYAWSVDGKAAGAAPTLEVKADRDHQVALATTDGTDTVTSIWKIALGKLLVDFAPKKVDRVDFGEAKEFSAKPKGSLPADALQVAWLVDGQKVADGLRFTFKADDPAYVRQKPVRVSATVKDSQGRDAPPAEWSFAVVPPAPQIQSASPADAKVERGGQPVDFEITAKPIGEQQLTYVFSVDGKQAQRGAQSTYRLPAQTEASTVTAKIEDNFKQTSAPRTWNLPRALPAPPMAELARAWAGDLEGAFQSKNAAKVAELRGLGGGDQSKLEGAFASQSDLRVAFSAPKVDVQGEDTANVTFDMTQSFVGRDGKSQSLQSRCSHVVKLRDGKVTDTATAPCKLIR